ncbi:glycosyltransferase [Flavobacterium adhaerens]|uniref:glycosyltransferase n=1 Tax=Flavobacterium adhaerens TaxID=3149043 RepID=UPI0032B40ED6
MKILYFYPENPLLKTQGNNARALSLLEYFKNKKIDVDFVGLDTDEFTSKEIEQLEKEKLVTKGYLLPRFIRKKNKLKYFFYFSLPNKIGAKIGTKIGLFDRTRLGHIDFFTTILKNNEYDIVLISYIYWAKLIKNKKDLKNAKLMIDTHDFMTSQFQLKKEFNLGDFFAKEIDILKSFDKILVISIEEKYLFSQFVNKPIELLTHVLPQKKQTERVDKYDLLYVASDNDHNIKGAKWFFSAVYPLFDQSFKIAVVGKICNYIEDFDNVEKILFVEDLDSVYQQTKVAICPMLSGTGLKIKVIEALSFGLPVVCNERGVDGLLNKTHNGCLIAYEENEFAKHIVQLLSDSDFYDKVSSEAISFFTENHTLEKNYKVLDKIFNS